MISSCSCTRFISTRQKKLGDGAAQQERARTSLPRCDPARWQSAQKYGTWTHEHVVSDRTMQSTGSLSGAWTAWLERLPDLRPSPAAPKSSTPALETILQKPLNGGILMCRRRVRVGRAGRPWPWDLGVACTAFYVSLGALGASSSSPSEKRCTYMDHYRNL